MSSELERRQAHDALRARVDDCTECEVRKLGNATAWICSGDLEMQWALAMFEYDMQQHEQERNEEDARTLFSREPEIFTAREDVDPYWPPEEVNPFEEYRDD